MKNSSIEGNLIYFALLAAAATAVCACADQKSDTAPALIGSQGSPPAGVSRDPGSPEGRGVMPGASPAEVSTTEGHRADVPLSVSTPEPVGAGNPPRSEVDGAVPAAPVRCTELAANPAQGLTLQPSVKAATSQIVRASGGTPAFCQVDILFGAQPEQNINIRLGLPLNELDGGMGGVHGAWNGRTQGVGGGGCSGSLNVNAPVSQGYVGSGTDLGHPGGDCEPALNDDGTYNLTFLQDFIRDAIKQQILFSKTVATTYYATKPAYNYWNGCSTGGRQGYLLAQELPTELDGILANAPALYWTRFQIAQLWGQIVMKELVGGPIAQDQLNRATASAVAACDAADGVVDDIIDDPRRCDFSARVNICGAATAPATNCLTSEEADAIDRIWDGPRNMGGSKIWFGLDRGTALTGLNGATPFALGMTTFHWAEKDRAFDWTKVSMSGYAQVARDGSQNIADITDTFGDLDQFKASGGKLLTFVGANDQLIFPRGVLNYYRSMASRYGDGSSIDFADVQSFYRLFRAPGVGHCGGGNGPQPQNLLGALVEWVERGISPEQILASSTTGGAMRSRPLCPYPQSAIYNGSGDTDVADNFHCGGNLEEDRIICADALVTYKEEVAGSLDFDASGLDRAACLNDTP